MNTNIRAKLAAIQQVLKAPKGQYNDYGGFAYRSCEDIIEAVKPHLAEHGVLLTMSDRVEAVGDRVYVAATATVTDVETGEAVSVSAYAREAPTKKGMDDSQITGTASSYARKYALSGLFAIDDTKDADTNAYRAQTTGGNTPQYVCASCGKPFTAYKTKKGKTMTPAQVYAFARQKSPDGLARCKACADMHTR